MCLAPIKVEVKITNSGMALEIVIVGCCDCGILVVVVVVVWSVVRSFDFGLFDFGSFDFGFFVFGSSLALSRCVVKDLVLIGLRKASKVSENHEM